MGESHCGVSVTARRSTVCVGYWTRLSSPESSA